MSSDRFTFHQPSRRWSTSSRVSHRGVCSQPSAFLSLLSVSTSYWCCVFIYQLEADGFHLCISGLYLSSESVTHFKLLSEYFNLKLSLYKPSSMKNCLPLLTCPVSEGHLPFFPLLYVENPEIKIDF